MLSPNELDQLARNAHLLDPAQKARVLELLEERDRFKKLQDARDHFLPFVKAMWPDFIPGAHHTIMAEAFEKIASGELKRLIINMPPRFTKSELSSWLLPAWLLGRQPTSKVIQASNTEALAAGFGRKVRNLIGGEDVDDRATPFADVFPGVTLARDSQAAAGWHTNRGGEYFAIGINGKVTGKGANCVVGSTLISTEIGPMRIDELCRLRYKPRVFSFNHDTQQVELKRVIATQRSYADDIYKIAHATGAVECTGAHRIFSEGDYRVASSLDVGQRLHVVENMRSVRYGVGTRRLHLPRVLQQGTQKAFDEDRRMQPLRERVSETPVRNPESRASRQRRSVLFEKLLCSASRREESSAMQSLRQADTEEDHGLLFHRMPHECSSASGNSLRAMRSVFSPAIAPDEILFKRMQRRLPLRPHDRTREFAFQGWHELRNVVRSDAPAYLRAGQIAVRELRSTGHTLPCEEGRHAFKFVHPPHRRGAVEQRRLEFSDIVPDLSHKAPQTEERSITLVELVRGASQPVYDIQVDGNCNFFANEILVHNCAIIDDAHSEQEAKQAENNPEVYDMVWGWYSSGIRQRLQPGGAIVIPMTRWSKRDLAGRLIQQMKSAEGANFDKWEVISFPAILDENTPTERSLWPGFWPLEELQKTRAALPASKWSAQYMQNPTSESAAIIKREYWRLWGQDANEGLPPEKADKCPSPSHAMAWREGSPPACKYTIGSWDCASSKNDRSHPSAYTLWGVFEMEDPSTGKVIDNLILLSAYQARMEFPELRKKAKEFYEEDAPDTLLIENKAAGMQLLQEFRSMGLPAESFTGSNRGSGTAAGSNDKIARANRVASIFASRYVWAPDRRFADEVITQCADFPSGEADDLVDSTVQALIRFREGGFIRTANDEDEKESQPRARRKRYY